MRLLYYTNMFRRFFSFGLLFIKRYIRTGISVSVFLMLAVNVGLVLKLLFYNNSSFNDINDSYQKNIDYSHLMYSRSNTFFSHINSAELIKHDEKSNNALTIFNGNINNSISSMQKMRASQITSIKKCNSNINSDISTKTNNQETILNIPLTISTVPATPFKKDFFINRKILTNAYNQDRTSNVSELPTYSNQSTWFKSERNDVNFIQNAPLSHYTLQLSSASQAETLNFYAIQHNINHYLVYQTIRNNKKWYVLISGVYPSISQAKNAIKKLPIDIQAKKPWIRQINQVKKDQSN